MYLELHKDRSLPREAPVGVRRFRRLALFRFFGAVLVAVYRQCIQTEFHNPGVVFAEMGVDLVPHAPADGHGAFARSIHRLGSRFRSTGRFHLGLKLGRKISNRSIQFFRCRRCRREGFAVAC